jgi:hypothetical protein
LQELSTLYYLTEELEEEQRRLVRLETENGTKAQKAAVRAIIRERRSRIWEERHRLERWIADIPDSLTRRVFTLRFVEGKSWLQVAMAVGGDNTADTVRKMAKRYAERH